MSDSARVAVLGCGAIGSIYAAHLARVPDIEVWAVEPDAAHAAAIRREGLRVSGVVGFHAAVNVVASGSELPPCELAIVATKARDTAAAMSAAADALRGAAVASVQNGIGNEDVIAQFVPHVIRGTIVPAGVIVGHGHVRYDAPGETWLGPFEPSPAPMERVEQLAALLTVGGLPTHALADARGPQWTKVVFNAATSPLAAVTGLSVGRVCTDPLLRDQVELLIDEALAVCAAAGIVLTRDPRESVAEAIEVAFEHRPSMLQDIARRRPTEVDVINGGIAAEGRRVGVPTPLHDAMVALVRGIEQSWESD